MVAADALMASCIYGQNFTVSLKAFLEGPFTGATMGTWLNNSNYLPLTQPYNTAPWNYPGAETVAFIPNANVVDWVLVELRETAGNASNAYKDNVVATQAGFILKNGNIVSIDGSNPLQFSFAVAYKLYAVVYHRNHLAVLSGNELINSGGNYAYDFTTGAGQAYGGANAQKEIISGTWGMVSGDGNADGQVNNSDKIDVWVLQGGFSGYRQGDFNLDGQVSNPDKVEKWSVNTGRSSQVIGYWYCNKPLEDQRDGQFYQTKQIGAQCWMAENLNVGNMIPGTSWMGNNGVIEKYCYNDSTAKCDVYGGLYQWEEAMEYTTTPGVKGICPDGWHFPTEEEYCTLTQFIDPAVTCGVTGWSGTDVGTRMKSTGGWYGGGNGTNTSGFSGLPGGYRDAFGWFAHQAYYANFWTSTEVSQTEAWRWNLYHGEARIYQTGDDKAHGFSVRCLRDAPNFPPVQPSNPSPPDNSANQPGIIILFWSCSDPENDPLNYDVYLGTSTPPGLAGTAITDTSYLTGQLGYNTTYYWKVVAHDDHGHTTQGPIWIFSTKAGWECNDLLLDTRDNQTYTTVQIGTQCWMAENLNIGNMIQSSGNQANNGTIEKYCYGNDVDNCNVFGGLYQWNEMMQYVTTPGVKGICADGWHLPTDEEWCTLEVFVDPTIICDNTQWRGVDGGGKLKEAGTAHWDPPNTAATNSSGFTALPAGWKMWSTSVCHYLTERGYFWSSTLYSTLPWLRQLQYDQSGVFRMVHMIDNSLSVRCLKD